MGHECADAATAARMVPLLHRGREALRRHIAALPVEAQPMGGTEAARSVFVVTAEDFARHPLLCLRHAVVNGAPTHILCEGGELCALLARHRKRRRADGAQT